MGLFNKKSTSISASFAIAVAILSSPQILDTQRFAFAAVGDVGELCNGTNVELLGAEDVVGAVTVTNCFGVRTNEIYVNSSATSFTIAGSTFYPDAEATGKNYGLAILFSPTEKFALTIKNSEIYGRNMGMHYSGLFLGPNSGPNAPNNLPAGTTITIINSDFIAVNDPTVLSEIGYGASIFLNHVFVESVITITGNTILLETAKGEQMISLFNHEYAAIQFPKIMGAMFETTVSITKNNITFVGSNAELLHPVFVSAVNMGLLNLAPSAFEKNKVSFNDNTVTATGDAFAFGGRMVSSGVSFYNPVQIGVIAPEFFSDVAPSENADMNAEIAALKNSVSVIANTFTGVAAPLLAAVFRFDAASGAVSQAVDVTFTFNTVVADNTIRISMFQLFDNERQHPFSMKFDSNNLTMTNPNGVIFNNLGASIFPNSSSFSASCNTFNFADVSGIPESAVVALHAPFLNAGDYFHISQNIITSKAGTISTSAALFQLAKNGAEPDANRVGGISFCSNAVNGLPVTATTYVGNVANGESSPFLSETCTDEQAPTCKNPKDLTKCFDRCACPVKRLAQKMGVLKIPPVPVTY